MGIMTTFLLLIEMCETCSVIQNEGCGIFEINFKYRGLDLHIHCYLHSNFKIVALFALFVYIFTINQPIITFLRENKTIDNTTFSKVFIYSKK